MVLHRRIWLLCVLGAWLAAAKPAWAQPPMIAQPASARTSPPKARPNKPTKQPVRQASATSPAPAAAAMAPGEGLLMSDPAMRPTGFIAQHPNPNEPLGFSESRFQLASVPVDPGWNSGAVMDDPIEFEEPLDPEGPAPAVSSGEWVRNGCWYTQQSAVYMGRSTSVKNEIRLSTDVRSATRISELATLEVSPYIGGWAPGLRSTLGRYIGRDPLNRDHSIEFTYLGLTHWQNGGSLTAKQTGSIFSDIDRTLLVPVFNASNFQSYSQTSAFNSYEMNYRIGRRLSRDQLVYTRDSTWVRQAQRAWLPAVFGGIRVVTIPETMKYLAQANAGNGSYDIATHNNMVGPQVGAELFYEHYEWRFGGRMKGAALVNWSNQSSRVRILSPTGTPLLPNRDEYAQDNELGFAGEMNFIGAYQVTPNFAFRTSYDLLWVTNLALAQNQITFSPSTPPAISSHHGLFYQGASIGFEWTR